MSATPPERSLAARAASHHRWAYEPDRVAATQPAREAFDKRFDTEVDPTGSLNPQERARRASSARKAYFTRLALKSAQCRRQAAEMGAAADAADRELSPDGDELR